MNLPKIVYCIFALFLSFQGFSQWVGFQASMEGMDISVKDPDLNNLYDPVPGFRLGPTIEFRFNRHISVETGVNFYSGGAHMAVKTESPSGHYDINAGIRTYYAEIPLLTRYYFPLSDQTALFIQGGLSGSKGLGGKVTYEEDHDGHFQEETAKVEWGYDPDIDDFKLLNLHAIAGLGVQYRHFQFGFQFRQGIADISPYASNGINMHTQQVNFTVQYKFTWLTHLIMTFHEYNKDLFIFKDF